VKVQETVCKTKVTRNLTHTHTLYMNLTELLCHSVAKWNSLPFNFNTEQLLHFPTRTRYAL